MNTDKNSLVFLSVFICVHLWLRLLTLRQTTIHPRRLIELREHVTSFFLRPPKWPSHSRRPQLLDPPNKIFRRCAIANLAIARIDAYSIGRRLREFGVQQPVWRPLRAYGEPPA